MEDRFLDREAEAIRYYVPDWENMAFLTLGYNDFHYVKPATRARQQKFYTFHLVLSGSGKLGIGNNLYDVRGDDIFFVPPDVDFYYYPNDDDRWQYIWCEVMGDKVLSLGGIMGLSLENPIIRCKDPERIGGRAKELFINYEKTGMVNYYEGISFFYEMVATNSVDAPKEKKSLSDMASSYIDMHYHDCNMDIEEMCKRLSISHSHLCRVFRTKYGKSPVKYLIDKRISEAKKLLRQSTMNVEEVGYSVGFGDSVHFVKTFKAKVGKTPTEYRAEI